MPNTENKNLTLTLGTKSTTENYINMLESAAVCIKNYLDASKPYIKTAPNFKPSIRLQDIKSVLIAENKYEPEASGLFVVAKSGPIPMTPIKFYNSAQLEVFLKWIMDARAKEQSKLALITK